MIFSQGYKQHLATTLRPIQSQHAPFGVNRLRSSQIIAGLQFSPCGNLIVLSIKSQNARSQYINQLCQVECGPEADLTRRLHVGYLVTAALPSTSAWHPSPKLSLLYAIACEDFSVHLIDGCSHSCLSSWASGRFAPPARFEYPYLHGNFDIKMDWSKDGHCLAMLLRGFVLIASF